MNPGDFPARDFPLFERLGVLFELFFPIDDLLPGDKLYFNLFSEIELNILIF